MVLLLPLTFGLDLATAIIMLTGIFHGAMYGGSTTSILVRRRGGLRRHLHRRLRNGAARSRRASP
jgi:putative tricarboxylic transport membrane protein